MMARILNPYRPSFSFWSITQMKFGPKVANHFLRFITRGGARANPTASCARDVRRNGEKKIHSGCLVTYNIIHHATPDADLLNAVAKPDQVALDLR